jgi:hypothetical protein
MSMDEWYSAVTDHAERAQLLVEVDALIESITTACTPLTISGNWIPVWASALRLAAELGDKPAVRRLTYQAERHLLGEPTLAELDLLL